MGVTHGHPVAPFSHSSHSSSGTCHHSLSSGSKYCFRSPKHVLSFPRKLANPVLRMSQQVGEDGGGGVGDGAARITVDTELVEGDGMSFSG